MHTINVYQSWSHRFFSKKILYSLALNLFLLIDKIVSHLCSYLVALIGTVISISFANEPPIQLGLNSHFWSIFEASLQFKKLPNWLWVFAVCLHYRFNKLYQFASRYRCSTITYSMYKLCNKSSYLQTLKVANFTDRLWIFASLLAFFWQWIIPSSVVIAMLIELQCNIHYFFASLCSNCSSLLRSYWNLFKSCR